MKKFISLLISLMIIASIAPVTFAEVNTTVLGEGDSVEYFAEDYEVNQVIGGQYLGATQDITVDGVKDEHKAIINGNVFFKFNSEKKQVAKLKIKWSPNQQNDKRYMLAFLNPDKTIKGGEYVDTMVEGVDYPAQSEAVINHQILWGEYTAALKTGKWNEEEITVTLQEGENLLWFPTWQLSKVDESNKAMYTQPYLNSNSSSANVQLLLYSLTVEIPNAESSTVYVKDLAWTQVNAGMSGSIDNKYNKSYMGDDPLGYTNMSMGKNGECIIFPFNITQNSDYIMKVYYAQTRQNTNPGGEYPVPAAVYLDANSEYTDSVYNKHMSKLWNTADATETIQEFKTVNGKTISPIINGTWSYTGSTEFINNGSQDKNIYTSYIKAPYFRVKTFDLGNLEPGQHTASFLTEALDVDGDGNTENVNKFLLVNRIEIIPVNDRAKLPLDVNTNVYSYTNNYYLNYVGIWSNTSLKTVKEARDFYANRTLNYVSDKIIFDAEFINNSDTAKSVTPILANYDIDGKLIDVSIVDDVEIPANHNQTVNKKYYIGMENLDKNIAQIKLFVFDSIDTIAPVHTATILDDNLTAVTE